MTRTCTTTAPPIPATRVETELGLKGHSRYQGTGSKPAAAGWLGGLALSKAKESRETEANS